MEHNQQQPLPWSHHLCGPIVCIVRSSALQLHFCCWSSLLLFGASGWRIKSRLPLIPWMAQPASLFAVSFARTMDDFFSLSSSPCDDNHHDEHDQGKLLLLLRTMWGLTDATTITTIRIARWAVQDVRCEMRNARCDWWCWCDARVTSIVLMRIDHFDASIQLMLWYNWCY